MITVPVLILYYLKGKKDLCHSRVKILVSAGQETQRSEVHHSHILDLCPFLLAHSRSHAAVLPHLAAAKAWTAARLLCPELLQRTCFLGMCLSGYLKNRDFYLDVAEDMPKPGLGRTVEQGGRNWGSPIRKPVGGRDGKPASTTRGVAPRKGPTCKNAEYLFSD